MSNENINNMGITQLRYNAKRLKVPNTTPLNKKMLQQQLQNIVNLAKRKQTITNVHNYALPNKQN